MSLTSQANRSNQVKTLFICTTQGLLMQSIQIQAQMLTTIAREAQNCHSTLSPNSHATGDDRLPLYIMSVLTGVLHHMHAQHLYHGTVLDRCVAAHDHSDPAFAGRVRCRTDSKVALLPCNMLQPKV